MKNIRKFLEVSTGNLPWMTAIRIEGGEFPRKPTYSNEYGWVFHVPEFVQELKEEGVECPYFLNIMSLAIDADCDYVMFDRDVEPVDWLPKFEW